VLHEHNDYRIHVEGVVVDSGHAALSTFFDVIGGYISNTEMSIPTNDGLMTYTDGELCNGKPAKLQAWVYRVTNPSTQTKEGFIYEVTKLDNIPSFILAPYAYVPPGDCVIIEFDEEKEMTDKICESYRVAESLGDIHGR